MSNKNFKYLIIGNSAGGIGAAEAIREVDRDGSLAILSDEPYHTYSRPLISEYLSGERTLEETYYRSADFYARNRIEAILGVKALKLDLAKRQVVLEGDDVLTWEKLLLSCGGKPIVPKTDGDDKEGIFTFLTMDDARKLSKVAKKGKEAVVVGGGLIGISLTEALVKKGVKVTIVEMKDRVLNVLLDVTASGMEEVRLKKAGVKLITGQTVQKVLGAEGKAKAVGGVALSNGKKIPCQMLCFAIGVSPRLDLVTGTDIKVGRGIVVDQKMTTSHRDVYACGDVAEAYDFVLGIQRLTPILPNAYIGGRTAGYNMAGREAFYPGGTAMNSLNYFGLPIASAGLFDPPGQDGYEVLSQLKGQDYRKVILKAGKVAGMTFVSDIARAGIVLGLMRDGVNVSDFKQALIADDFSFASLPDKVREERFELALTGAPRNGGHPSDGAEGSKVWTG